MELATGGTLRDALASNDSAVARSASERIADATAVIGGLAAIHAAGIVASGRHATKRAANE